MRTLLTAEKRFRMTNAVEFANMHREPHVPERDISADPEDGAVVYARANYGRWVVDCVACGASQIAFESDPRYACAHCDAPIALVVWPENKDEISEVLVVRPQVRNRNWELYETANDLRDENAVMLFRRQGG